MPSVASEAIQVIGDRDPDNGPPAPALLLALAAVAVLLLSVGVAGWWLQRPTPAERLVFNYARAIDRGDAEEARRLMTEEPTVVMWPGYWNILHADLIRDDRDGLDGFVAYHSALEGATELRTCTVRDPAPQQPQEYDHWVRCGYTLTDSLLVALADSGASSSGRLSFGITNGAIHTVFVARMDMPSEVFPFTDWIAKHHPDFGRSKMLYVPSRPGIPFPIVVLAGLNFDAEAARSLLGFAEEYKASEIHR